MGSHEWAVMSLKSGAVKHGIKIIIFLNAFSRLIVLLHVHSVGLLLCLHACNKVSFFASSPIMSNRQVSLIRKYHNHTLQTNPRYCEEEPQNVKSNKTSGC